MMTKKKIYYIHKDWTYLPVGMVMECVSLVGRAFLEARHTSLHRMYNITCLNGCKCGIERSKFLKQNLKSVDCSFLKINAFPGVLPNDLQALSLRGNDIFNVLPSISQLTDLRELDLSGNRIKTVGRDKMFQNMTLLFNLNIGKNDISTINRDVFIGPKALEHLILSDNKISYIDDEAFADLRELQTLELELNFLGSLYRDWFHGLSNLVVLNLAHNRIHNIPASVFQDLNSLERLYLAGNRVSTIDPRAFSGLISLQVLTLEDNLMSWISTSAFQSLPVLDQVTLDRNPISKIKPLDFSHMSVSKISLSQMPELRIIDSKAFYNLPNISTLQIAYNKKLSYIDPLAFMNVDTLTELQLHHNNLIGIQKDIIQHLPDGLELSLYENPFKCDCNIRWLKQIIGNGVNNTTNSSIIINLPDHLVCKSPDFFADKNLLDIDIRKLNKPCGPTVLNLTLTENITGKVGDRKVLECRSLGDPIPRLHWVLSDGSLVNTTLNEVRRRFFAPGTLVYYHLKPTDAGPYTCISENYIGKSEIIIKLNVSGIDINLFPIGSSATFITLVWNGTERLSFPQYKINYWEVDKRNGSEVGEEMFKIASPTRKTFTISRLHPNTAYKFCIGYEDNSNYWLRISCCTATTQDADFLMQGISRTSNVAVASVIGILLVMTVTICLVSVLSRKYRQRMYETPEKSADNVPLDNIYRPLLNGG
ncbi:unnamed protein product, partial [Meganyctiphanes norvegica]